MRRPRPHTSMGPEGIGRVLSHGSSIGGRALPDLLAFYEQLAEDLKAGRRQIDGYSPEQAKAMAEALLGHVGQARLFPGQIREAWEDLGEEQLGRGRVRARRFADLAEAIVGEIASAYASGIAMGFFGARVAVEEMTQLVEKGWTQEETARERARESHEAVAERDTRWCARGAELAKTGRSERERARIIVEEEETANPPLFYGEDNVRRVLRRGK